MGPRLMYIAMDNDETMDCGHLHWTPEEAKECAEKKTKEDGKRWVVWRVIVFI